MNLINPGSPGVYFLTQGHKAHNLFKNFSWRCLLKIVFLQLSGTLGI
jgi:hypothetical protein